MAAALSKRARVMSSAVDQVFASISNGLILFAVAIESSPESFGKIALMMTGLIAVLAAQRGALGTPLLLKADQPSDRIRNEGAFALTAALGIGAVVFVAMVFGGWTLGLPAVLLAASAPAMLAQDVLRYVAIAEGRAHLAAVWDGIWCGGTVLMLIAAWVGDVTLPLLIGGWGALALTALLGMSADLRIVPALRGWGEWGRAGLHHRIRYGLDAGLDQLTVFTVLAMVAAVLSAVATAALRGATVMLAPIGILGSALQLIIISESTREAAQPKVVWYALMRLTGAVACLTLIIGGTLSVLPEHIGMYLLGESFAPAQYVLPVVTVEYITASFAFSIGVFLRTYNRSADALRFKVGSTIATVVAATVAAFVFHSAIGVAVGLTVATILAGVVGLALYTPWVTRERRDSVDIAGGQTHG